MRAFLILLMVLSVAPAMSATSPDEILADTVLEERARSLGKEIRCLVCQNQSIDDSDAPLARDLRLIVRERLVAGESDDEILDHLVARYGDFVLLKPPINAGTLALWGGPFVILIFGALMIAQFLRNRPKQLEEVSINESDTARAASILGQSEQNSS